MTSQLLLPLLLLSPLLCAPCQAAAGRVRAADCADAVQCRLQAAGWSQFNSAWYLRVTEARSWLDSKEHCNAQQEGAHLASILSSEEDTFIWGLMTSNGTTDVHYHIGFEHLPTEPDFTFHWTDDSSVGYTNWYHTNPDYDQTQHLGTSMYTNGFWYDVYATHDTDFQSICKFNASSP